MPKSNPELEYDQYEPGAYARDASTVAFLGAFGTAALGLGMTATMAIRAGIDATNHVDLSAEINNIIEVGVVATAGTLVFSGLHIFFAKRADRLQQD